MGSGRSRPPIRVLIVDDHAIVRRGIRALLATEPGIEVVEEADDGREAVVEAERLRPDVILMDLVMPHMGGIEATRRISARWPEVRVLVLTSYAGDDKIFPAIKAGALGYLLKDSSPEDLVSAIHRVYRGELSLHPTIAQKVLQELPPLAEQGLTPDPLTEREMDVLRLMARGEGNQKIAGRLGCGETTVRRHVRKILGKLHLASRREAVLYALQEGLASLEDLTPSYVSRLLAMLGKTDDSVPSATGEGPSQPARSAAELPTGRELDALRSIAADYREVGQELALAGEIQASFLPDVLPHIPGWQLAATLEPARETAGDFYDFVPLPDGRVGIVVADVADKGMGAALFMALSRTLIRTYAAAYDTRPDLVLAAVNERILMDTRAGLYVTVFYAALDPAGGMLTYSNAGHNPPYLLDGGGSESVRALGRTGMPLGVLEEESWELDAVSLLPGDVLVLYTDGVTDAQDEQRTFFGKERLLRSAQASVGRTAREMRDDLLAEVHRFVGDCGAYDDITLMVLVRTA